MSILYDFEKVKKQLGEKEWSMMNRYCQEKNVLLDKVIYSEEGWKKYENFLELCYRNKKE